MARSKILTALLLPLLTCCSQPSDGYQLISSRENDGRYEFDIELNDTTLTYSTIFAARIETARISQPSVEFQFNLSGPDGETAIERVSFPLSKEDSRIVSRRNKGTIRDYSWPWRENIHVAGKDAGTWHVSVSLPDQAGAQAVLGTGLSYKGEKHGKR